MENQNSVTPNKINNLSQFHNFEVSLKDL